MKGEHDEGSPRPRVRRPRGPRPRGGARPGPRPGEVVVDLAVADVIFLDTLLRGGWVEDAFPLDLPYIPGVGGAGRVLSVGDGVDPAWVGRLVAAARGQQKLE